MAIRCIFAGLLLLGLAACTMSGVAPAQSVPPAPQPGQYRLDSGDVLRVIVFGQERLSGTYTVDDGGSISMPLLPPLGMRGLTVQEAESTIGQALGETLLRNPSVAVEDSTFRPFFILGEVNRPGQYPYVAGMTVETAVAIAGGYTYRANRSRMRITRPAVTEDLAVTSADPVHPGDTVFIRERYF